MVSRQKHGTRQGGDILSGTSRSLPQNLSNRDLLESPKVQNDPHLLQRRTLPQNPERGSRRSVHLVPSPDGRGQGASGAFGGLDRVYDGARV